MDESAKVEQARVHGECLEQVGGAVQAFKQSHTRRAHSAGLVVSGGHGQGTWPAPDCA
jgi:hypothetical protein